MRAGGSSLPADRRYTGQIEDAAIGLYFYNARYYDPLLARFLSADTVVPEPGNPQSLNRYSYCLGNPVKYTDPTGHVLVGGIASDDIYMQKNIYGIEFATGAEMSWRWSGRAYGAVINGVEVMAESMADALIQRNSEYAKTGDFDQIVNVSSPAALFKEAMGGITFRIMPQCEVNGCHDGVDSNAWGWSQIGELGEVWINTHAFDDGSSYAGFAGELNTVHELMHGLDQRGGGVASGNLKAAWAKNDLLTADRGGFVDGFPWQQRNNNDPSEVFADMGLGWAYGQWELSDAGRAKAQHMATNMPNVIALAVNGNR